MDTWNPQANEIFLEALGITSAEERAAYLARVCSDNVQLRAQVEAFLLAHQQAGTFLESPVTASMIGAGRPAERPGAVIGPYKLLEQIGEGGFGIVFMAEQIHPIRRKVALKIIKPGMDTRQVIARFEVERQALALMDHPNIARVFDAGETATGRPYFVMELVKGIPITAYCDQNELPLRQRLELFIHVCNAVQHAHHKGIVHRDIKPSNILITLHDGEPMVKIIDFGIAKAMGQELTDRTLFTGFAQVLGTPMYASPEQIAMSGMDIDTRTDVYSLGVLLYELLTGGAPFERERLMKAAFDEMRRIICEEDPPRPSQRVTTLGETSTTIAAQRASQPRRLAQLFRGELDWIVMKALEKNRSRRYDTPQAFAGDVARYLANEPVEARQPTVGYKMRKFVRRHTWGTAVAAAAVFLLVLSTVLIWNEQRKAQAARRRAEKAQSAAVASAEQERYARDAAVLAERRAVLQLADNYTSRGLDDANDKWNARSALWFANAAVTARDDPERLEANLIRMNTWLRGNWTPVASVGQGEGGHQVVFNPATPRYLMTYMQYGTTNKSPRIWDLSTEQKLKPPASMDPPSDAVWTDRGQLLLGSATGRVALTSMPDMKILQQWDLGSPVQRVAISEKTGVIAAASGKKLLVWSLSNQAAPTEHEHPDEIVHLAFSSAGTHLLTATEINSQTRVFSIKSGGSAVPQLEVTVGPVKHNIVSPAGWFSRFPAFVNGGRELFTLQSDQGTPSIKFYDVDTGAITAQATNQNFWGRCGSVSPDGRMVGVGGVVYDAQQHRSIFTYGVSLGQAFSADGKLFANAAQGVTVYNITQSGASRAWPMLAKGMTPAFSSDGRFLATLDINDGMVQVWQAPSGGGGGTIVNKIRVDGAGSHVAFSRDGQYVTTIGNAIRNSVRSVQVCETTTGKPAGNALPLDAFLVNADFSPDGGFVAVVTGRGTDKKQLRVWNWRTGLLAWAPVPLDAEPISTRYAPDGQAVAVQCLDGTTLLLNAATGQELLRVHGASRDAKISSSAGQWTIAFSRNGQTFYTWGTPMLQAWDRITGRELFAVRHDKNCWLCEESPDGRILASGGNDGRLHLVERATGKELHEPIAHPGQLKGLAFSPDGKQVATACDDWQTRVWDVATGKLVYGIDAGGWETDVRFTSDGRFVVTAGGQGLQMYEAKTGLAVSFKVAMETGELPQMDVSSDGRWAVISASSDTYATVNLQKLINVQHTAEQALTWSELLSNSRIAGSEVCNLTDVEWFELMRSYRAAYPQAASVDFAQIRVRDETRISGETLARQGKFQEAAKEFRATAIGGSGAFDEFRMAAYVNLQADNQAEYADRCLEFYDRFKNESADYRREQLAKTCAIGLSSIEVSRLETLLNYPQQSGEKARGWTNLTKGIVFYRGGKWQQSIDELTKSLAVNNGPEAQAGALFYQAMSHWQLHNADQARGTLQKGCQVADSKLAPEAGQGDLGTQWMDWIMVYQARQEAEKLIGVLPATRPTTPATRATLATPDADTKVIAAGEHSLPSHALTGLPPP